MVSELDSDRSWLPLVPSCLIFIRGSSCCLKTLAYVLELGDEALLIGGLCCCDQIEDKLEEGNVFDLPRSCVDTKKQEEKFLFIEHFDECKVKT